MISGYAAVVDADRLGLPLLALVRLRYPNGNYKPFHDLLETTPEIIEAHHVTGDDCFVLKVTARSMKHLEETTGRIGALGSVTTSIVYSSPLPAARSAADTGRSPARAGHAGRHAMPPAVGPRPQPGGTPGQHRPRSSQAVADG